VQSGPVDRDGSHALWDSVRQSLADEVERGRLPPGSRVPSERALSERLGVSRVTVRRALAALERSGVIETSPGLGRFVRMRHVEEPPNELVSFSRMARSLGLDVTSRVLVAQERPSTLDEAEALSIAPGAAVVELERLRLLDGVPVVIDHSLVPAASAPGLLEVDFTAASLYDELAERHGILAWRAEYVVQAEGANECAAELLGLAAGEPVLVARQTTVDPGRRPFQLSTLTYRGDRYRFRSTLVARPAAPAAGGRRQAGAPRAVS
jgi:DNA-binding GntR family transcriptional regulator